MGLFSKITDYFDEKRDREIADIDRRMALSRYQNQLINLYRYLVNEKKKEQYIADIYGTSDAYEKLKDDIAICWYLIDRCDNCHDKEEFIADNREYVTYIFSEYQNLLYPEGR